MRERVRLANGSLSIESKVAADDTPVPLFGKAGQDPNELRNDEAGRQRQGVSGRPSSTLLNPQLFVHLRGENDLSAWAEVLDTF